MAPIRQHALYTIHVFLEISAVQIIRWGSMMMCLACGNCSISVGVRVGAVGYDMRRACPEREERPEVAIAVQVRTGFGGGGVGTFDVGVGTFDVGVGVGALCIRV